MTENSDFKALSIDTLPERLGSCSSMSEHIGADFSQWEVQEVGDGNLNLVFIVEGTLGKVIVKQALPYVRLVGDSWPLPLKRSYFEYHALKREEIRDPGRVPQVFHFDETQAIIIMEFLSPHVILRYALIEGRQLPRIAKDLGHFLARTLFRGSDLSMPQRERKDDLALFADNAEICDITECLVFSEPYYDAPRNRHTSPQLDTIVAELRADRDLKVAAQCLKHLFATNSETMLHGDLHSGSVMVTDNETRVIDPEFAFYGPMAFDIGMLLANFWMSYFSQAGHETDNDREHMRQYLLEVIADTWKEFKTEFTTLWRTERTGILYQKELFEDQGDTLGSEQALDQVLHKIWIDLQGFAGVEIHRRILGLAHNADFETITDLDKRATCETKALKLGRHLAVNCNLVCSIDEINALAERLEKELVT
ncbi:MAG: S-methyl-5-thioribose kinase [Cohaesibacteraceae bacterium]|nr:S-methyl-5-thioribose kinase [Cohaesibacteraceae bacterium]